MLKGVARFSKFVVLALALPTIVAAEPDAVVNWLMNEQATLWDLGMLNLEEILKTVSLSSGATSFTTASYNWDENRLEITVLVLKPYASSREEAEAWARDAVSQVRTTLFVDPVTGKKWYETSSLLSDLFAHSGFARRSDPQNIGFSLEKITRIKVTAFYQATPKNQKVEAEAKLLDSAVLFKVE